VNHLEGHWNLSEKSWLFQNLQYHYEKLKDNVFMATPITFFIKVDFNKSPNSITKSLQEFLPIYYMLEETKSLFKQLQD